MTTSSTTSSIHPWHIGVAFLLIVPAVAHFLFSWMGMNPTDDGFTLVICRRLLDGQIPHLDFISIRPVGTGLLWTPVVYFGGDYTIWLARYFVWVQFASIAWIWTIILPRFLRVTFDWKELTAIGLIAFAFTARNFVLVPWTTLDGLWISTLGVYLCLSPRSPLKFLGYVLMGSAFLFKQNYLVAAPAVIIILNDWRQIRYWVAMALPGLAYVLYLVTHKALGDAVVQLASRTELFQAGVVFYIKHKAFPIGVVLMLGLLALLSGKVRVAFLANKSGNVQRLAMVLAGALLVLGALCLMKGRDANINYGFGLFGMLAAGLVWCLFRDGFTTPLFRAGLLVFALGWISSLSLGHGAPDFASGMAIVYMFCVLREFAPEQASGKLFMLSLYGMTAVILIGFAYGRCEHIYHDRPARQLTYPLDDVLAGAKNIKTNETTYAFMKDLHDTVAGLQGREYAVIPDCAIYWVKSPERNPLSIDWPQDGELSNKALFNRVVNDMESRRGQLTIVMAKYAGFSLGGTPELFTQETNFGFGYSIVFYVRSHFQKKSESKYFEVYE